MGGIFDTSDRLEELNADDVDTESGSDTQSEFSDDDFSRFESETPTLVREISVKNIGNGVDKEEADKLYALSKETITIERFISHSWSAGRFEKWLALCHLHHLRFAMGLALAWWALSAILSMGLRLAQQRPQPYTNTSAIHVAVPTLLFLCALVRAPEVFGSTCFLDKLCVHQYDPALKRAGISSLSDCLRASRRLTILWSEDYFERLWCIFEVAVFTSEKKTTATSKRLEFEPLWLPPFLLGLLACNILVVLGSVWFESSSSFSVLMETLGPYVGMGAFWVITNTLPALLICWLIQYKSSRVKSMLDWLACFELGGTKATVESDRSIVYSEIQKMFGSTESFEQYVRTEFRDAVLAAVGRPWAMRYEWAIIIFMPYAWFGSVDVASISADSARMQGIPGEFGYYALITYFFYIVQWCVLYPAVLWGLSYAQNVSRSLTCNFVVYQSLNFVFNIGLMVLTRAMAARLF